MYKNDLIDRNI